ncbi:hypothetical protein HNQ75_004549, partial [Rhizobium flavum]|nr:hypothetical protein [Pseudorhizobium flavum]
TATPPAPYSTLEGALASGFAITQLHHSAGHDLRGRPPELLQLNCGHSSIGMFPYNIIAARKVLRFLMEIPTLKELWEVRNSASI